MRTSIKAAQSLPARFLCTPTCLYDDGNTVDTGTTADANRNRAGFTHDSRPSYVLWWIGSTKNVLGTMMHSFALVAIIAIWMVCGYAMCFNKYGAVGLAGMPITCSAALINP